MWTMLQAFLDGKISLELLNVWQINGHVVGIHNVKKHLQAKYRLQLLSIFMLGLLTAYLLPGWEIVLVGIVGCYILVRAVLVRVCNAWNLENDFVRECDQLRNKVVNEPWTLSAPEIYSFDQNTLRKMADKNLIRQAQTILEIENGMHSYQDKSLQLLDLEQKRGCFKKDHSLFTRFGLVKLEWNPYFDEAKMRQKHPDQ